MWAWMVADSLGSEEIELGDEGCSLLDTDLRGGRKFGAGQTESGVVGHMNYGPSVDRGTK